LGEYQLPFNERLRSIARKETREASSVHQGSKLLLQPNEAQQRNAQQQQARCKQHDSTYTCDNNSEWATKFPSKIRPNSQGLARIVVATLAPNLAAAPKAKSG
jgi:hypothetical protein